MPLGGSCGESRTTEEQKKWRKFPSIKSTRYYLDVVLRRDVKVNEGQLKVLMDHNVQTSDTHYGGGVAFWGEVNKPPEGSPQFTKHGKFVRGCLGNKLGNGYGI